jgi:hypothetical protein
MAKSFSISRLQTNVKENWPLLIILAIAAIVRYWGISFGLPNYLCRPDAEVVINVSMKFLTGDLNPRFFVYPTFHLYLLSVLYLGYYLMGKLTGKYLSVADFFWERQLDSTNIDLINRHLTAFLGVLTVAVTYQVTKRLWGSLAALHVRDSHFGTNDVPNAFWILSALLFIVKSYQEPSLRNYLLAGIMAGLSASTKYTGVLMVFPMMAVHVLNILEQKDSNTGQTDSACNKVSQLYRRIFIDKRIYVFAIALVGSFLLTMPYVILDFSTFYSKFIEVVQYAAGGHHVKLDGEEKYFTLGRWWWYHGRYTLLYGLGWSLYLVSLTGVIILCKKEWRKAIILLSYPVIYYLYWGNTTSVFMRYMVPLIPFLCIAGAVGTEFIYCKLIDFFELPEKNTIAFLLAIVIILPSAYTVIRSNTLLSKKDNRLVAAEWISQNIPEGSTIYHAGMALVGYANVMLHPDYRPLIKAYDQGKINREGNKKAVEYIKNNKIKGYNQLGFLPAQNKFYFNNRLLNILPQYIITRKSALTEYDIYSDKIQRLLDTSYHLIKEFVAMNPDNKDNWFNRVDAFYLPFVGFKEIERPGPNIYIYKINGRN